jgi:hypothetical protein
MYEADTIPAQWAYQCNLLDEVWVPSAWQRAAFEASGVLPARLRVMHETVDAHLFSPAALPPLRLPGSATDGFARDDPARPFAFCSVFKMESRKGWKELVRAYTAEYLFDPPAAGGPGVVLILRTYRHSGGGLSEQDFSRRLIEGNITEWLDASLRWLLQRLPHVARPPIEVGRVVSHTAILV